MTTTVCDRCGARADGDRELYHHGDEVSFTVIVGLHDDGAANPVTIDVTVAVTRETPALHFIDLCRSCVGVLLHRLADQFDKDPAA